MDRREQDRREVDWHELDRRGKALVRMLHDLPTPVRNYFWALWNRWGTKGLPYFESQAHIAEILGVCPDTVRRWERAIQTARAWVVSHKPGRGRTIEFSDVPPAQEGGDSPPLHGETPRTDEGGPPSSTRADRNKSASESSNSVAVPRALIARLAPGIERATTEAGNLGVDGRGLRSLRDELARAGLRAAEAVTRPELALKVAWEGVLRLASGPRVASRAAWLMSAVKGSILQAELEKAIAAQAKIEREEEDERSRREEAARPRTIPPNMTAMYGKVCARISRANGKSATTAEQGTGQLSPRRNGRAGSG